MIKKIINQYQYISFDVFDTLLERKCLTPQDLFFKVGKNILGTEKGKKFVDYRKKAEKKAYQELGSKANLNDIYNFIYVFDDYTLKKLKKEEITQEIKNCYPKSKVYKIYQYALKNKKDILITSDMYLSQDIIKKMLFKCNYRDFKKIYVSNEYNADKISGKLFEIVLRNQKINSNEIIHIGDSIKADIIGAKKRNIKSVWIPKRKLIKRYLTTLEGK